jgi:hypothetical protein
MGEFRTSGLLWLLNRAVLHPRGFAVGFSYAEGDDIDTAAPIGWVLYGDGTEAWRFPEDDPETEFMAVENLLDSNRKGPL